VEEAFHALRRTFHLGMDRNQLNQAVLGDNAVPMAGICPAG
jgi:hypothetical protein